MTTLRSRKYRPIDRIGEETVVQETLTPPVTPRKTSTTTPNKSAHNTPTPTKKQYKCRKCGLPRLGHPRSTCPVDEDREVQLEDSRDASPKPKTPRRSLTKAMSSMRIQSPASPVKPAEEQRREMARHRRRSATPLVSRPLEPTNSLASISSSSLLDILDQPGVLDKAAEESDESNETDMDVDEEEEEEDKGKPIASSISRHGTSKTKVVRWQDAIRDATRPSSNHRQQQQQQQLRPGHIMPGSLDPPSFNSSQLSPTSVSDGSEESQQSSDVIFLHKQEGTVEDDIPVEQVLGTIPFTVNSSALFRDLTKEESTTLITSIVEVDSPGLIITVPKGLSVTAKYAAEQVGLFTRQRIITEEEESFLVVGKDEKEVERLWLLLLKLEGHQEPYMFAGLPGLVGDRGVGGSPARNVPPNKNVAVTPKRVVSGGQTLGLIAGGAAVGAAAMFTALAT